MTICGQGPIAAVRLYLCDPQEWKQLQNRGHCRRRLTRPLLLWLTAQAILLTIYGPLLDHHFAERQPNHLHIYFGHVLPNHTHAGYETHTHHHDPITTEGGEAAGQVAFVSAFAAAGQYLPPLAALPGPLLPQVDPAAPLADPAVGEALLRQGLSLPPPDKPPRPSSVNEFTA
ncbi:MAG: hypothetical protein AB1791_23645 [Chloroflexota bacterium]